MESYIAQVSLFFPAAVAIGSCEAVLQEALKVLSECHSLEAQVSDHSRDYHIQPSFNVQLNTSYLV